MAHPDGSSDKFTKTLKVDRALGLLKWRPHGKDEFAYNVATECGEAYEGIAG
jgi:hypothetical protein